MLYHLTWTHKGETRSALWWFYMDEEGVLGFDTCDGPACGPHTDRLFDPVPSFWELLDALGCDIEWGTWAEMFALVPAPEHMDEWLSS